MQARPPKRGRRARGAHGHRSCGLAARHLALPNNYDKLPGLTSPPLVLTTLTRFLDFARNDNEQRSKETVAKTKRVLGWGEQRRMAPPSPHNLPGFPLFGARRRTVGAPRISPNSQAPQAGDFLAKPP